VGQRGVSFQNIQYAQAHETINLYSRTAMFNSQRDVSGLPGLILKFPIGKMSCFKVGLGWIEQTCMFSEIQFKTHFIEFIFVETKPLVGSHANVNMTRPTCGQRSSRAAASNASISFSRTNLIMFLTSQRTGVSDLGLYMTSGLANLQHSSSISK